MRRILAPTILVFVLGIVPTAQADDHKDCSVASLQGSFGFTSAGTLLALPVPSAGVFGGIGRQTFDGHGNTEGTATGVNKRRHPPFHLSRHLCGYSGLHGLDDTPRRSH